MAPRHTKTHGVQATLDAVADPVFTKSDEHKHEYYKKEQKEADKSRNRHDDRQTEFEKKESDRIIKPHQHDSLRPDAESWDLHRGNELYGRGAVNTNAYRNGQGESTKAGHDEAIEFARRDKGKASDARRSKDIVD